MHIQSEGWCFLPELKVKLHGGMVNAFALP
jgi:hypothetical protein